MKIVHLITGLERGGAEAVLARLLTHTDRGRFPSLVVSMTDLGSHGADLRAAGIPVETLGMRRGRPSVGGLVRLIGLLRRERPALLLTWLYHADLAGLIATRFVPGIPLVWNLRCSAMDLPQYSRQVTLVRRMLAGLSRMPAAVAANSEAGRAYHQGLGYTPRRWISLPNGFDTELFRPDDGKRATTRRQLGVADAAPLIGMVARADPMKDHATFFAAATRIAAALPEARFLLVGSGTDSLVAPPALAGKLQALGERDDIPGVLSALDLAILASFGEGFPNVVGEAMASGVPVVATDVGDTAAIVGATGAVAPVSDAAGLAAAAVRLLTEDENARRARSAAARRRIVENYSIAAMVGRYAAVYDELGRA